ncbi:MAG: hypothetical protein H6739_38430 [Alphaproteobacteria bacterium]|nr:hypothetical protein [Alphaproteobacteria bacterium]
MRLFLRLFAALLIAVTFGAGCTPYTVLKQSAPSALLGQTSYHVEPSYDNLKVGGKSEDAYLAEKDADTRESFQGDKEGMHQAFVEGFASAGVKDGYSVGHTGAKDGDVEVTVSWEFVEPGVFTAFVNIPTRVAARVAFSVNGELTDEIMVEAMVEADVYHPSSGQRMRDAARICGGYTARYIRDQTSE